MSRSELSTLTNTRWEGKGELWLDPLGNEAHHYDCTLAIEAESIRYVWHHEGKAHEGTFELRDRGATWTDTWHQIQPVECAELIDAWGLLALHSRYALPGMPDWGWRTTLSLRPTDELVLQMTNIAPWGEEARAVRMTFKRAPSPDQPA